MVFTEEDLASLKRHFDDCVQKYNRAEFITHDPVSVPHRFTKLQDIEIAGFFAAIFAWGQRATIINKANLLMDLMGNEPYSFIMNHTEADLKPLSGFVHRTFNDTDLLYFVYRLKYHYQKYNSLENAFLYPGSESHFEMTKSLSHFYEYFTADALCLHRTKKHIANPLNGSTCKRLLMFLRWMVRKDDCGVDFGIWHQIPASSLMIPYDVHVDRIARHYQLIHRPQKDWKTVEELSEFCRMLDPDDPARYDYALFGLSVNGVFDG